MDEKEARSLYQKALALYKERKFIEALRVVDDLEKSLPRSRDILYLRAICLAATGNLDGAEKVCVRLKTAFQDERTEKLILWLRERKSSRRIEKTTSEEAREVGKELGLELEKDIKELPVQVKNRKDAEDSLAQWKRDMPQTKSAYKPSGKCPLAGYFSAALGVIAGIPGGLCIGGIAVLLCTLMGMIIGIIFASFYALGIKLFIMIDLGSADAYGSFAYFLSKIYLLVVLFLSTILSFCALGGVAGEIAAYAGKIGKNRSKTLIAFVAYPTGLVACILFSFLVRFLAGTIDIYKWYYGVLEVMMPLGSAQQFALDMTWFSESREVIIIVSCVIGLVLGTATAGARAIECIEEAQFCEDCLEYMKRVEVKKLSWNGCRIMAKAISDGNIRALRGVFEIADGNIGNLTLFHCRSCKSGYIDLTVGYQAEWKETIVKHGQTTTKCLRLNETWVAFSEHLDKEMTEALRGIDKQEMRV